MTSEPFINRRTGEMPTFSKHTILDECPCVNSKSHVYEDGEQILNGLKCTCKCHNKESEEQKWERWLDKDDVNRQYERTMRNLHDAEEKQWRRDLLNLLSDHVADRYYLDYLWKTYL